MDSQKDSAKGSTLKPCLEAHPLKDKTQDNDTMTKPICFPEGEGCARPWDCIEIAIV